MKKFFDEMTSYMDYMRDSGNADFNGVVVNEFTYTAKYWPIKMLQRWNNYCDLALKEIEKTKALNDGTYEALHDRILLETLFPGISFASIMRRSSPRRKLHLCARSSMMIRSILI